MATIGERIKELRFEKGLTQKAMAQHLSVTVPTLSHWECNYQEPSSRDLGKLCDFFAVSADYLLGRTDDLGAFVPPRSDLSLDEQQLLHCFRELPGSSQSLILSMVKSAADAAKRA